MWVLEHIHCTVLMHRLTLKGQTLSLPNFPLCSCHIDKYYWVGMLLQDASVSSLNPIPYTRVLRDWPCVYTLEPIWALQYSNEYQSSDDARLSAVLSLSISHIITCVSFFLPYSLCFKYINMITLYLIVTFGRKSEAEDLRILRLLLLNSIHTPQELNLKDSRYCLCYHTERRHADSQQLPWVFLLQLVN